MGQGWVGVDLDGTLALYEDWKGAEHIGPPIPAMQDRVREWLAHGVVVKIVTARAAEGPAAVAAIEAWCKEHLGEVLPVTDRKDYGLIALYDDRAVAVEKNTGAILGGHRVTILGTNVLV